MDALSKIKEIKLVPVVVFKDINEVDPILNALKKGDVPIAEICYRTECAPMCLKKAISEYGDMVIGAGTIINKNQCVEAINYGAKFIVSPGFSDDVYEECKKNGIPYIPGVLTPTEIMHALDKGLNTVKFFPAGEFGGLKAIKALSSAFPQVMFMPTGGVNNDNLNEFLSFKKIIACGGSWLVKGSSNEITSLCLTARDIVKNN